MSTSRWLAPIVLLAAVAADAETIFKIATLAPDNTPWLVELRTAGENIKTQTQGRVKFKFYPGGVMGDDATVMRKVRAGQLHGGIMLTSVFAKRVPSVQVLTHALHFENYDEVDLVRVIMDPIIVQDLMKAGYVCFGLSEIGFAYAMSRRPITTVESVRKFKVWVPKGDQVGMRVMASFGVSPISLSPIDVLTGLQTGLIDTVTSPPSTAIALQWHSQVKYVFDLPLLYLYGVYVLDSRLFDKLSPDDQEIVRGQMARAAINAGNDARRSNIESMKVILERGVTLVTPTAEQASEWKSYARKAKAELLDAGQLDSELYAKLDRETEVARKALAK